jgi:hypothetical protein
MLECFALARSQLQNSFASLKVFELFNALTSERQFVGRHIGANGAD